MGKEKIEFDTSEIANRLGLTAKQQTFCDLYLFVCGLDGEKAMEMSDYSLSEVNREQVFAKYTDKSLAEYYYKMQVKREVGRLLGKTKIQNYIKEVRDKLNDQFIVDKLWIKNKLKELAMNGSERTQLEATKLLGQTLSMFTEIQKIEMETDAASVARAAFEKRMQEKKESEKDVIKNMVPFVQKEA